MLAFASSCYFTLTWKPGQSLVLSLMGIIILYFHGHKYPHYWRYRNPDNDDIDRSQSLWALSFVSLSLLLMTYNTVPALFVWHYIWPYIILLSVGGIVSYKYFDRTTFFVLVLIGIYHFPLVGLISCFEDQTIWYVLLTLVVFSFIFLSGRFFNSAVNDKSPGKHKRSALLWIIASLLGMSVFISLLSTIVQYWSSALCIILIILLVAFIASWITVSIVHRINRKARLELRLLIPAVVEQTLKQKDSKSIPLNQNKEWPAALIHLASDNINFPWETLTKIYLVSTLPSVFLLNLSKEGFLNLFLYIEKHDQVTFNPDVLGFIMRAYKEFFYKCKNPDQLDVVCSNINGFLVAIKPWEGKTGYTSIIRVINDSLDNYMIEKLKLKFKFN